jgi:hypothetical protein
MQRSTALSLLLPVALACSGTDPAPTEGKPDLATGCTTLPTLTAPSAMTLPPQTAGQSKFWLIKNNCPSPSVPWDITVSRTGPVASAGPPSQTVVILDANETQKLTVPFTTGTTTGIGTITLKATWDGPPITVKTATQKITVLGAPPGGGRPYGVLSGSHWATNTTLAPNMEPFTLSGQKVSASGIIARMTAANSLGIKLMLELTGGAHADYMSVINGQTQFDRKKWTDTLQKFNTSQIQSAVASRVSDGTVVAADVMDEPYVSGAGDGNTWGPVGTMVKHGTSPYDTYRVTVAGAGAPAGATSIPITSLYKALPNGTVLTFLPGLGKTAVLTQAAAQGATTLIVQPLVSALSAGNASHSNSVDNMVAAVKNMFPTLAVGVSHQHMLFQPESSYVVTDFIIDQYNAVRGDKTQFKNDGLALGARDGHKVVFSLNLLDGGTQDPTDACLQSHHGTFGHNCWMTPAQVQDFASTLADGGPGFFMWRYDSDMFADPNYQAAFQAIAAAQANLSPMSWHR